MVGKNQSPKIYKCINKFWNKNNFYLCNWLKLRCCWTLISFLEVLSTSLYLFLCTLDSNLNTTREYHIYLYTLLKKLDKLRVDHQHFFFNCWIKLMTPWSLWYTRVFIHFYFCVLCQEGCGFFFFYLKCYFYFWRKIKTNFATLRLCDSFILKT